MLQPTPDTSFDAARWAAMRYFNLFRLIIAAAFLTAGRMLELGQQAPTLFIAVAGAYLLAVLLLGFPDAGRRLGLARLVTLQVLVDVTALTILMWSSGGYRSGIPLLMLVVLAGAGLVAEGRMVLFYAALATVAVLAESAVRLISGGSTDFFSVGLLCIGFFTVATVARLLALRAKANERLAVERGEDLQRQQALNEQIIRDMPDGVVVLSAQGQVRLYNPRATALLGAWLAEGEPLSAHLPTSPGVDFADPHQCRVELGSKTLQCKSMGTVNDAGDVLIYLEDLDRVQSQAQQIKLAALGRLTASIAHEIRNPLSAVTHAAELLREEKRSEMQVRLIRIINDNSLRIEQLVRDVLALGRRDQALAEKLVLDTFVRDFLDEFTVHDVVERGVFHVELAADLTIAFDRAHLHQILWNLLGNARRYCSGLPESIRIGGQVLEQGRTALLIVDDGPGIPVEARSQAFEPFYTTHSKGTGLGLYIARELAEANRAAIDILENQPGAQLRLTGRSAP